MNGRLGIKAKQTIWYSSFSLVLMTAFLILIHTLFSHWMLLQLTQSLKLDADSAAYETQVVWDAVRMNTNFSERQTVVLVYSADNRLLMGTAPKDVELPKEIKLGEPYQVGSGAGAWMACDKQLVRLPTRGWIRAMKPLAPSYQIQHSLSVTMMLCIPIFLLVTALGGYQITKRAFQPISTIVETAKQIGRGDVSSRIALCGAKDEIQNLADTLDEMLDRLEESFLREKQFADDASHELRTPLTIIHTYAEDALTREKTTEESQNAFSIIHAEAKKMQAIISQLLMLARSYEDKSEILLESLDMSMLVNIIAEEYQQKCEDASLTLKSSIEDSLFVIADQTLLARIVINLLENAMKYNQPNGGIQISLQREDGSAVLTVTDTGIGIDHADLPYLFNRFYRADRAKFGKSPGLGLSIVKWLVEVHHGEITADSAGRGMGSRFRVVIPLHNRIST